MNRDTIQNNVDIIKFTMRCSSEDAYKYLDYKNQINTDCMGNFKEFLPKIINPKSFEEEQKKFNSTYK